MASGLVAVDEALRCHGVDDGLRVLDARTRGFGGAGSGLGGLADGGAQTRAQSHVGNTVLDGLPGCFFC